jgi:hypothetical protein
MKPHAAATRVDRALANLERRQCRWLDVDELCELRGDRRGIVGLVELELDGVIAIGIELQLIS